MVFCTVIYTLFALLLSSVAAFAPAGARTCSGAGASSSSALYIDVDPAMVAVAVASASAGAAIQIPRLSNLKKGNDKVSVALEKSKQEYAAMVTDMEEKLFQMDNEFEAETSEFQRTFESRVETEAEKVRAKAKEEYGFTLAIKVQEEREKMLQEKLAFIGTTNAERDVELVQLRLNTLQNNQLNKQLKALLAETQRELETLRSSKSNKGFFSFLN